MPHLKKIYFCFPALFSRRILINFGNLGGLDAVIFIRQILRETDLESTYKIGENNQKYFLV